MELMQLEMFVAVVEERSFQRAAERVFRTQPAVSLALRKLEQRIGTPLLDRSRPRDHRLTHAGEVLYEYASWIVGLRSEVLSVLTGESNGYSGRLCIGICGTACLQWIPRLNSAFSERYPNVRVEVLCDQSERLLRALMDHRLDLALLATLPEDSLPSSNLVATPIQDSGKGRSFWLVQPRVGRSHVANVFGELIASPIKSPVSRVGLARLKRTKACIGQADAQRSQFNGVK
jgi:DNA-binding transcriptional LysR family regulator